MGSLCFSFLPGRHNADNALAAAATALSFGLSRQVAAGFEKLPLRINVYGSGTRG